LAVASAQLAYPQNGSTVTANAYAFVLVYLSAPLPNGFRVQYLSGDTVLTGGLAGPPPPFVPGPLAPPPGWKVDALRAFEAPQLRRGANYTLRLQNSVPGCGSALSIPLGSVTAG
jgi:hypothetical protein